MAGAATAAPAPVLELRSDRHAVALPMTTADFAYAYRQSIYDVPVREELRVSGGRIAIERALSADLRALEYFRWPGAASEADGALQWRAPENGTDRMVLVVVPGGGQRIEVGRREVVLGERFGEDARVTVSAGTRPLLLWLWGLLPWA